MILRCFLLLLIGSLSACGGERVNDSVGVSQASLDKALQEVTDNSLIPALETFASEATTLSSNATAFCAAPDSNGLSTVQQQWRRLATAWYQVLPYNFGPLNDNALYPVYKYIDSLRVLGDDNSSNVRSMIRSLLNGSDPVSAATFSTMSSDRVGLLALEIALFERSADQSGTPADILAEYQTAPRKCDLLQGLSSELIRRFDLARSQWTSTDADNFRTQYLSGELTDGTPSFNALLIAAQDLFNYLAKRDVSQRAAKLAANNWGLMHSVIASVEEILEGNANSQLSFISLMSAAGEQSTVTTVRSNIAAAYAAIEAKDSTSFNAMAAALDGNFKRDIPDALKVQLSINFTDGD